MKVSKAWFLYLLSAIVFSLGILSIVYQLDGGRWDGGCFHDLGLRYNEICCARKGVDPFLVWSGEKQCEGFVAYPRPDVKTVGSSSGRKVHAYPAWHLTYFWWLPWFSFATVKVAYAIVSVFLVGGLFVWLYRKRPVDGSLTPYYLCALSSVALYYPMTYFYGNYGILLAVLLAAFLWCYQIKRDVLAGIIWAFMMVKPQVSVLLAIPILIQKRYTILIVAVAICVVAILPPAFLFGESPFDLILQIPEIGRPYIGYETNGSTNKMLKVIFDLSGLAGVMLWSAMVVAVATFAVCRFRKSTCAFVIFAPVVAAIPLWNYSQAYDSTVLWAVMAGLYASQVRGVVKISSVFLAMASFLMLVWSYSVSFFHFFSPTGLGWIYVFVHLAYYFVLFCTVIYVSWVVKRV